MLAVSSRDSRVPVAGLTKRVHTGYVIEGRMVVKMDDGSLVEYGPGDAFFMLPGHDAWIVSTTSLRGEIRRACEFPAPISRDRRLLGAPRGEAADEGGRRGRHLTHGAVRVGVLTSGGLRLMHSP